MTLPGCSTQYALFASTPKTMGAMAGDNSGVRAMFQPRSVAQKRAEALGVSYFFDHIQIVRLNLLLAHPAILLCKAHWTCFSRACNPPASAQQICVARMLILAGGGQRSGLVGGQGWSAAKARLVIDQGVGVWARRAVVGVSWALPAECYCSQGRHARELGALARVCTLKSCWRVRVVPCGGCCVGAPRVLRLFALVVWPRVLWPAVAAVFPDGRPPQYQPGPPCAA